MKKTILKLGLAFIAILVISGCNGKVGSRFVVNDDTAVVTQGQSVEINVVSNDSFTENANEHGTNIVIKEITQAPTKGVAVVNSGNNTITYTANASAFGDDTFKYSAYVTGQKELYSGGTTEFNTTAKEANVTVHITEVPNAKPVANAQTVELNCDVAGQPSVTITLSGSDEDGDSLTYSISAQPLVGTLSSINGNSVTYTDTGYGSRLCTSDFGQDMFKFKANDGLQDSNEANVTIIPVGGA